MNVHGTWEISQVSTNNSAAVSPYNFFLSNTHVLDGDLAIGMGFKKVFPEPAVFDIKLGPFL
jgi:hypothetical protein